MNQLSMFDMGIIGFKDDTINEIVSRLDELCEETGAKHDKPDFRVWSHVPHLGHRLTYRVEVPDIEKFMEGFERIQSFADRNGIELSANNGYSSTEDAVLYIFSMHKGRKHARKAIT